MPGRWGCISIDRGVSPTHSADRDDTPAAAPAPTPGVLVRTAAKAHPLTPARQVVLEEEEQVGWLLVVLCGCGARGWGLYQSVHARGGRRWRRGAQLAAPL